MEKTALEELLTKFKLVCCKCGSENVVADCESGIDYGGETGWSSGSFTVGCNDCQANDFYADN